MEEKTKIGCEHDSRCIQFTTKLKKIGYCCPVGVATGHDHTNVWISTPPAHFAICMPKDHEGGRDSWRVGLTSDSLATFPRMEQRETHLDRSRFHWLWFPLYRTFIYIISHYLLDSFTISCLSSLHFTKLTGYCTSWHLFAKLPFSLHVFHRYSLCINPCYHLLLSFIFFSLNLRLMIQLKLQLLWTFVWKSQCTML